MVVVGYGYYIYLQMHLGDCQLKLIRDTRLKKQESIESNLPGKATSWDRFERDRRRKEKKKKKRRRPRGEWGEVVGLAWWRIHGGESRKAVSLEEENIRRSKHAKGLDREETAELRFYWEERPRESCRVLAGRY